MTDAIAEGDYMARRSVLVHVDQARSLFQPDVCLPEQWAMLRKPREVMPEKRLLLAILEDAIDVLRKPSLAVADRNHAARHSSLYRTTLAWVEADEPGYVCSFVRCCEALDLDVTVMRAGLLALVAQHASTRWLPASNPWPSARLADLRARLRCTYRQLADRLQVKPSCLYNWTADRPPVPREYWGALERLEAGAVA